MSMYSFLGRFSRNFCTIGSVVHEPMSSIRHCRWASSDKRWPLGSVPHWAFSRLHPPLAAAGYDLASLGQVHRGAFLRNRGIARKFLLLTTLPLRFRLRRMPHWGTAQLRALHDRVRSWVRARCYCTTKKAPTKGAFSVVGLVGLEPMTSTMSTWRSSQLSYNPTNKKIIP